MSRITPGKPHNRGGRRPGAGQKPLTYEVSRFSLSVPTKYLQQCKYVAKAAVQNYLKDKQYK